MIDDGRESCTPIGLAGRAQWPCIGRSRPHTPGRAAEDRLTPVLLTALSTGLVLMPVAWRLRQPGHRIEGPMAVVILGGLVSSTVVCLLLVPPLAIRWLRPGSPSPARAKAGDFAG